MRKIKTDCLFSGHGISAVQKYENLFSYREILFLKVLIILAVEVLGESPVYLLFFSISLTFFFAIYNYGQFFSIVIFILIYIAPCGF